MKHLTILLFLTFSANLFSQITADEIINKYFENTGGKDTWANIDGLKFTGTANFGVEVPFETVQLKNGNQYTKITFQGKDMMQNVFDGTTLWGTNFMTQKNEKASSEDTENFIRNEKISFPSPFTDYASKGFSIEFLGEETKEGTECFKVKLNQNNVLSEGAEVPFFSFYYFDKENFVPILIETTISGGPMKGQLFTTSLSDYQEFNGLWFPMSLNMQGATLKFNTVELNPNVEEKMFILQE